MAQQTLSYYVIKGYVPYIIIDGKKEYKYKKIVESLYRASLFKG
jgi:hypothetical protein